MTYFWADAIGLKGKYKAGESAHVKGLVIKEATLQAEHAALVQKLIAEGWKPSSDRGVNWWELRFTR
jgi:hypothetical protein